MDTKDVKTELVLQEIITSNNTLHLKFRTRLEKLPDLIKEIHEVTSFLKYDAPIKTRLHCIIQEMVTQPTCSVCGKITKMRLDGKYRFTFPETCGPKCFSQLDHVKEKRKKTNQIKYQSTNYLTSQEGKDKVKKILKEKYGVSNAGLIEGGREKRMKTILEKYDSIENFHQEVAQRRQGTIQQKYNTTNPMLNEDVQKKQKQTNIENHHVQNVWLSERVQQKRKQTMIEKYGFEYPIQNEDIRKRFEQTMVENHGVKYFSSSKCSPESLSHLNDRNWLEQQHKELNKTAVKIANELDVAPSTVLVYLHKHDIELINYQDSQAERDIGQIIKDTLIDEDVQTNVRTIIPPHELDIYIPSRKLAFEFNGTFWHSEQNGKSKQYHNNKTNKCEQLGIRLIHISDYEWELKQSIVISRLNNILHKASTIYARKCSITKLSSSQSAEFFELNHIQGNAAASIRYGLEFQEEIVAVMTFGKSRFSQKHEFELIRYANRLNTSVVGGASRLFKHFIKNHQPTSVVSFSDRRWNTGKLYKILGFQYSHTSEPNYRYFKPSNSLITFPRQKFQKHKLSKILEVFNPSLTEWNNMVNNGYDRIWDCGNDVYVYHSSQTDSSSGGPLISSSVKSSKENK